MSRCFPFPPPGYTQIRDKDEVLNGLIKLQEEKQRIKEEKEKKKERKEEKRRKGEEKEKKKVGKEKNHRTKEEKEKKKERKEEKQRTKEEKEKKRKEGRNEKKDRPSLNLNKSDIVKAHIDQNICSDTKVEALHKNKEAETEQLECSSLTEEHGNPVCLPVPSSSSDSTENSNKRKRDSPPNAKAILIRLPLKKQNDLDALAKEQPLCTTSGRTDVPAQNDCCTSNGTSKKNGTKSVCNAVMTPMQKTAFQYRNLLEDLIPPQVQDGPLSPENLDWLFKGKNQEIRHEKRQKAESGGTSCSRSSGLWPRAEYLHEIDTYALPYTVPY